MSFRALHSTRSNYTTGNLNPETPADRRRSAGSRSGLIQFARYRVVSDAADFFEALAAQTDKRRTDRKQAPRVHPPGNTKQSAAVIDTQTDTELE